MSDRICRHANRIHPLGAGMFVCFACWIALLTGRKLPSTGDGS